MLLASLWAYDSLCVYVTMVYAKYFVVSSVSCNLSAVVRRGNNSRRF